MARLKRDSKMSNITHNFYIRTISQSLQIQDADGFDRFKNGFIVDNFTGHGIGDVGNVNYKENQLIW